MHTVRSVLSSLVVRLPLTPWSLSVAPKWSPEPGLFFVRRITPDCLTFRFSRHSDLFIQRTGRRTPLLGFDLA